MANKKQETPYKDVGKKNADFLLKHDKQLSKQIKTIYGKKK